MHTNSDNNSTLSKDEWLLALQVFLNARLRTPPQHSSTRSRTHTAVPLPLPNTQHLIDGVMWSLRDNRQWTADAWLTVQSHLQSCAQRYAQLAERLSRQHTRDPPATTAAAEGSTAGVAAEMMESERLYACHACVQDIYISFCVVDAFLRHTGGAAREAAEVELPRLVAAYFPIWESPSQQPPALQDAVEEYRLRLLDLLRSWSVTRLLRADTHRRIEEHLRHKLKSIRESLEKNEEDGSNDKREEQNRRSITAGLRVLLASADASKPSFTRSFKSSSSSAVLASSNVDIVRTTISSFLSAIFPSHRSEAGKHRCGHCGAIFKSIAAKNTHYRYHFYNRSYQTEEKIVRLLYPSVNDYIEHQVDYRETGNFVRTSENMLDVFRIPEKGTVRVRKEKQQQQKEEDKVRKKTKLS
ncbi:uncharacterized protein TM35_000411240 [Trypanosoma theileri]|uniref:C2H2-type domain-containing protein n=1 Tax=Trypanosoma theileri TaxID=67003 RepID=A0A1X0NJ10_9TRYP|nr:uncharacterized protein TM35_000411240 [Trypanosoma theileri]ORC84754.1 hypothetical protein TM35_000411240 [Trypanosoma theileri]